VSSAQAVARLARLEGGGWVSDKRTCAVELTCSLLQAKEAESALSDREPTSPTEALEETEEPPSSVGDGQFLTGWCLAEVLPSFGLLMEG
jgi:hypothetical protein